MNLHQNNTSFGDISKNKNLLKIIMAFGFDYRLMKADKNKWGDLGIIFIFILKLFQMLSICSNNNMYKTQVYEL